MREDLFFVQNVIFLQLNIFPFLSGTARKNKLKFAWFSLPVSLTLTDVPLRVKTVAGETVTDVAVRAVLTIPMTTNASA